MKKKLLYGAAALVLLAAVAVAAILIFVPSGCDISYTVLSYDAQEGSIRFALDISDLGGNANVALYVGDVAFSDVKCSVGRLAAEMDEVSDVIELEAEGGRISLTYTAWLGWPGKHGLQGAATDSYLAFEGGNVFLMPDRCFDAETKHVRRLSARYELPDGWTAVTPFSMGEGGEALAELEWPSWNEIYVFRKSAFVFGALAPLPGFARVMLAPGEAGGLSEDTHQGFEALYAYFDGLMGEADREPPTFVILPQTEDGDYILAGAGGDSIAATFSAQNARDWELLGHRLFHAYFESRVKDVSFHAAPKLWFYEGLACYYELQSVQSLPPQVKQDAGIGEGDPFQKLFAQFVYMRFKDPALLALIPLDEESYSWAGALVEFLHYTQAPLIVRVLEDQSVQSFGEADRPMRYILSHQEDADIPLRRILEYALGDDRLFWNDYVAGAEIPPLWRPVPESGDSQYIEGICNEIEHTLWTWFVMDISSYPEEPADIAQSLSLLDLARGSSFTDEKTERRISESLPTVYALLKARAYRAEFLGLRYDDPELRFRFIEEDNLELWNEITGEGGGG